jgi:hypothetical protein
MSWMHSCNGKKKNASIAKKTRVKYKFCTFELLSTKLADALLPLERLSCSISLLSCKIRE